MHSKRAYRGNSEIWKDFHSKMHLPSPDLAKLFHKEVHGKEDYIEPNKVH